MPKVAKELSALAVKNIKYPAGSKLKSYKAPVGGVSGLWIQVMPSGHKSWLLITVVGDKRRSIGLGAYPEISLQDARNRAREMKEQIRQGFDPILERRAAKAALIAKQNSSLTFRDAVERYLPIKLAELSNDKHRKQWRSTLDAYAIPAIGDTFVADITMQDVLKILEPIWLEKTETAKRLRGRLEDVLNWATVHGYRQGENPARWLNNLKEVLPQPNKVRNVKHHPALPYDQIGAFVAALKKQQGAAAKAMQFVILTACRTSEAIGATWDEFDLDKKVWTIPAERIKARRTHRVALADDAIRILGEAKDSGFVFEGQKKGKPLSNMAMLVLLKRMEREDITVHGFRSTFRDWAAEQTNFPREVVESALAHANKDKVEAAYLRSDLFDKRRQLMETWASYVRK